MKQKTYIIIESGKKEGGGKGRKGEGIKVGRVGLFNHGQT